jgi:hypothetical protein
MRDKLIELIRDSHCVDTWNHYTDDFKEPNPIDELADHLLANGIIVPPCKVGDTVYMIQTLPLIRGVVELTVENLVIGINPNKCRLYCKHNSGSKDVFYEDSFGRILFFTYEEAEAALKGGGQE